MFKLQSHHHTISLSFAKMKMIDSGLIKMRVTFIVTSFQGEVDEGDVIFKEKDV